MCIVGIVNEIQCFDYCRSDTFSATLKRKCPNSLAAITMFVEEYFNPNKRVAIFQSKRGVIGLPARSMPNTWLFITPVIRSGIILAHSESNQTE